MTAVSAVEPAPSATVVQALEAQTTPALMRELQRYAESRVQRLRAAGSPVSATQARELVADAYADTQIGELLWNPERFDLGTHLRNAIRQRTWRELRRVRRFQFLAWHEVANDDTMQIENTLARSPVREGHRDALAAVLVSTCQRLRHLARHEWEVSVLTKGWEVGLVEQDEILEGTGLSRAGYTRARKRALTMSRQLPEELRETVRALLQVS